MGGVQPRGAEEGPIIAFRKNRMRRGREEGGKVEGKGTKGKQRERRRERKTVFVFFLVDGKKTPGKGKPLGGIFRRRFDTRHHKQERRMKEFPLWGKKKCREEGEYPNKKKKPACRYKLHLILLAT